MNDNNSQLLTFKSYKGDPLAALVIDRLQWAPWKFGIAYVIGYIAFLGITCLIYLIRDGGIAYKLLGGYGSCVALLLAVLLVGGLGSSIYLYISKKGGELYKELSDRKIINSTDVGIRNLVVGDSDSISKTSGKRKWMLIAIVIVIIIGIIELYISGLDPARESITRYRSTIVFVTQPIWSLGIYMIVMTMTQAFLTISGLHRIFHVGEVSIHPIHPDRCGGLKPLRDYALKLSYLVALFGFGIISFAFIMSQVVEDGSLHTDLGRTAGFASFWIFVGVYVVLAPLSFFGTLHTAHEHMQKVKRRQIERISDRFNKEYKLVYEQLGDEPIKTNDHFENLQRLRELHRLTENFPVWPWDWGSIRLFAAAVTSPLAVTLITVILNISI